MLRHSELLKSAYAIETINLYINHGKHMGHFMTAIFANDLFGAYGRADAYNKSLIPDYVFWIYNYAPHPCHGSYEKVENWIKNHPKIKRKRRKKNA